MRIKLVEFRANRSQNEMARMYGVTQQAWSSWETGRRTPPPSIMKKIESDSGIPMEEIFFDAFNNQRLLTQSEQAS